MLLVLSLVNVSNFPKLNSSFDDKIKHFVAYFIFGLCWGVFFKTAKYKNIFAKVFLFGLTFGLIIEVLQYTLTTYRSFDIFDVAKVLLIFPESILVIRLANCLGEILKSVISIAFSFKYDFTLPLTKLAADLK